MSFSHADFQLLLDLTFHRLFEDVLHHLDADVRRITDSEFITLKIATADVIC